MRDHGVLKDIYTTSDGDCSDFKTAKGARMKHRVAKAPGFSPAGLMEYLVPITSFVRMSDIGADVLPSYNEEYIGIDMTLQQRSLYDTMSATLTELLRKALATGDHSLMGMVLMTTLAWPDTCFRREICRHPRSKEVLLELPPVFADAEMSPKEEAVIDHILRQKKKGRRCLLYTVFSGLRDTLSLIHI